MAGKMEKAALGAEGGPSGFVSGQGRTEDSNAAGRTQSQSVVVATVAKNNRETVHVALRRFDGLDLVDVRVWTKPTSALGRPLPTTKGVSLSVRRLPALVAALAAAEAKARELGLIGEAIR